MKILTRQQAIEQRETSYFTGVACKRGHISERWTRNGGCKKCMYPDFVSKTRLSKSDIRSGMTIRKFRVKPTDLDNFKMTLWALSMLRRKELELSDLETRREITRGPGETYIYSFWIFPADEVYLRRTEQELNASPESSDITEARRRALESIEREAAALEEAPPAWKP
jgi:hypothetical protein